MDFITVYRALNVADAELLRSRLEAANLQPTVVNEDATLGLGAATSSGGIYLEVPSALAAAARELIEASQQSEA